MSSHEELTEGTKQLPQTYVVRIRRAGGQVVQACDVYIGRRWRFGGWDLSQSKWANPFTVKRSGSAARAVSQYQVWLRTEQPDLLMQVGELRGKVLGCWCKPGPCHGDVLARLSMLSKDGLAAELGDSPAAHLRKNRSDHSPDLKDVEPDGAQDLGQMVLPSSGRSSVPRQQRLSMKQEQDAKDRPRKRRKRA